MSIIVADASLLALSSLLLTEDETCLRAGTHLRWTVSPELGLPYAGFRVRMRPAPRWPWPEGKTVRFTRTNVATSMAGVHIAGAPLRVRDAVVLPGFTLTCNARKPIKFVYEQREHSEPLFQPWTRFAVILRAQPGAENQIVRIQGFVRRSGAEAPLNDIQQRFGQLPSAENGQLDERVATITGDELHAVNLTIDSRLEVIGVRYCTAQEQHFAGGWKQLAWLPPLCEPGTANVAAPQNARQLALERLVASRPRRRPADPAFVSSDPILTLAEHERFEGRIMLAVDDLAASVTRAFRKEIDDKVPPGLITADDVAGDPSAGGAQGSIGLPFHGMVQAGSFANHVAAILGLAHFDDFPVIADREYDFEVEAVVSVFWLMAARTPVHVRKKIDLSQVPAALIAPDTSRYTFERSQTGFVNLVAFNIARRSGPAKPLASPALQAQVETDPARGPVQARVNIKIAPQSVGLRPILRRLDINAAVPIGPIDWSSRLLIPAIPGTHNICQVVDTKLATYGITTYQAVNIDQFGRASAGESASVDVRDTVPPSAPGRPEIVPGEAVPADSNQFPQSQVAFTWTDAMAAAAPDLARFYIVWRAGHHTAEEVMAQPGGQTVIAWPLSSSQLVERSASGIRVLVAIDATAARSVHRREWTVICLAEDTLGNRSVPSSPGHVVVLDEIRPAAPAQPPEPQWTAWPDEKGEARFRLRWIYPAGASAARISSASESRILRMAQVDAAAHRSLSPPDRAFALKTLAVATPNAFVAEAPAYPISEKVHDVVLQAGSDDYKAVLVEYIGQTGQKAPWPTSPDAFAVIRSRPVATLPTPSLVVERDGRDFLISVSSTVAGASHVFAFHDARQAKQLEILTPIASILADSMGQIRHSPVVVAQTKRRWIGFGVRIEAADGRKSSLSPIIWREMKEIAE